MLYKITEKIFQLEQKGEKIYKMNIGEPDWPSIPEAVDAAKKALDEGKTKYASAQGEKELLQLAAKMHKCDTKNVIVSTGSKWAIFSAIYLNVKPDEEVIVFSPHWTAFELMIKQAGAKPVIIDLKFEDKWAIDLEFLKSKIGPKTKMIILNNPVNPTSHAWSEKVEQGIIEIAKEKRVLVLLDTAYRGLAFDKMKDPVYDENVIIAYSFAKPFGMTGWRLGHTCANEEIVKKMMKFNQITLTNTPVFIQAAGIEMLKQRDSLGKKAVEYCKERAKVAMEIFDKGGMEYTKPKAGFYLFPKLNRSGIEVANELLDKYKIAVVPGAAFGNYDRFVRISLCYSGKTLEGIMEKIVEVSKCKLQ
ncbi:MAG: pyridoxal phosphate-dependent aminotransferase [Candidatus Micrarchaeota archaeon]